MIRLLMRCVKMTCFLMSNKSKGTINDVEDIFIKENKGTIRIPRLFDLKIALLLTLNSRNHNIKFLNAVIFALFGFKFLSVLSVHVYMVEGYKTSVTHTSNLACFGKL